MSVQLLSTIIIRQFLLPVGSLIGRLDPPVPMTCRFSPVFSTCVADMSIRSTYYSMPFFRYCSGVPMAFLR